MIQSTKRIMRDATNPQEHNTAAHALIQAIGMYTKLLDETGTVGKRAVEHEASVESDTMEERNAILGELGLFEKPLKKGRE